MVKIQNSPEISVIVPVYNAEKWLHRCVDSILAQTFSDFELLLIDDGSTDGSGKICDEYPQKDSRIRVFHKKNGGVSSARNLGLDNARGEWIAFCDSDDAVCVDWLENFGLSSHWDYDLICQGLITIDADGSECRLLPDSKRMFANMCDLISYLDKIWLAGFLFIKLFRKEIIQAESCLRFNCQYDFMEDEEFILRYLACSKKAIVVPHAGYRYYVPDTDKHNIFSFQRVEVYKQCINLFRQLPNGNLPRWVEKKYHSLLTTTYIKECESQAFSRKAMGLLREYIQQEYKYCPLFCLTKWAIYADPSGCFSSRVLKLHLKFRKS